MNNYIEPEQEEEMDKTPYLRQKEQELIKTIEAINAVLKTEEWSTLKQLVFDGILENLEKRMQSEAQKKEVDNPELYRLQGQIAWAKTYADLGKLSHRFTQELSGVKQQLK